MPIDEPVRPEEPAGRVSRGADVVLTIVLLVIEGALALASMMVQIGLALGTDNCGYQPCGNQSWLGVGFFLGVMGAFAVFITAFIAAMRRLVRRRQAFVVPLIGCAAQLIAGVAGGLIAAQAGPL